MRKTWLLVTAIFGSQLSFAQNLYEMPQGVSSRVSSFENPNGIAGSSGKTNHGAKGNAFESLKAGESKILLESTRPGIINRIWCTVSDRSPDMLRSMHLRIYWDGDQEPAVDVPFGDFFCAGGDGGPIAFQSALFANPEGRSFISYIQMPFAESAKVILTNESNRDQPLVFYDIDFTTTDIVPADALYFHATWTHLPKTEPGHDFAILEVAKGKGRFLGTYICVKADSAYGHTWWGEGEVKVWLDGDSIFPTICGTGSEDYAGTGWGMGRFITQYSGCTVADDAKRFYAFYRLHIPDPIFFNSSCKVVIQEIGGGDLQTVRSLQARRVPLKPISISGKAFLRLVDYPVNLADPQFPDGWVNFYRSDDYAAVAYFYLSRPGK